MARRVFLHIGLPKTGTTYLQTIMWKNREQLLSQGVLLPGRSSREHLWASCVVREDPKVERRSPKAPGSWDRLLKEVAAWTGDAVISHEFFAAASQEQAARAIAALGDAEVHVVLTARDTLGLVTARWQEVVKNGSTLGIDGYPASERTSPENEWGWGSMDAGDALERWGAGLPSERVHVVTLPRHGEPRDRLWRRFAELVGVDPDSVDSSSSAQNESLGVVEVELLRRVNGRLSGFSSALDRGAWIRGYLAQEKLVPRKGERFWPEPGRVSELRERSRRTVDSIKRHGYDVIGELDDLLTPDELPQRRHPSSVTDAELVDAATATIADMLSDVRRLTRELSGARQQVHRARRGRLVPRAGSWSTIRQAARRVPLLVAVYRKLRPTRGS